ncbi:hypothetical protein [Xanthocytophaga flava]|uniref:hypothetical protein n=1 Tax=Xanthocytophaga flava TaxID=3048013 RepID=UPI0028D66E73|nr:hypothetical protein [Xanthocytophaga flavus]MDJ1468188.1 hypothetical protein [Xanthocytophaga flavus]
MQKKKFTESEIVQKNNRFAYLMKNKQEENNRLIEDIDAWLEKYGIVNLPFKKSEFNQQKAKILMYDEYGESLANHVEQIINLRYALGYTTMCYAVKKLSNIAIPVCAIYSRHRLDQVWNFRKAQIIRSKYYQYLMEGKDDAGELIRTKYHPCHLVLTVPHSEGLYKGKRFYARELMSEFNKLRKLPFWKEQVYAGEYGVEVKKNNKHGLHIHVHSLVLLRPGCSVNKVRSLIEQHWRQNTSNKSDYSGIHFETLYTVNRETGKKKALNKRSSIKEYLAGVLECIKYHFEPKCLEKYQVDDYGKIYEYDIDLIQEILDNTKGMRLYSRFGAFYKCKELNFNNLDKETESEEEANAANEEDVMSSVDGYQDRMIDPETLQKVNPEDCTIIFCSPTHLSQYSSDTPPQYSSLWDMVHKRPFDVPLKEILKEFFLGKHEAMKHYKPQDEFG